jgi:hypothetical protein
MPVRADRRTDAIGCQGGGRLVCRLSDTASALIETFDFRKGSRGYRDKVMLTDGGVFENLGCRRSSPADYRTSPSPSRAHIISLNAGAGQMDGESTYLW